MDVSYKEEENNEAEEEPTAEKTKHFKNKEHTAVEAPQPSSFNIPFCRQSCVYRRRSYVYKSKRTRKKSRDSFYCSFCQATFCSDFSLMRHLVQIHNATEALNSKQIPPSITSLINNTKKSSSTPEKEKTHTMIIGETSVEQSNAEQLELSKPSGCYHCCFCNANFLLLHDFSNHMWINHSQESKDNMRHSEEDYHDLRQSNSSEFSSKMQNLLHLDEPGTSQNIPCTSCRLNLSGPQSQRKFVSQVHPNISSEENFVSTSSHKILNVLNPLTPSKGNEFALIKSLGVSVSGRLGVNVDISEENDGRLLCTICGKQAQETGCYRTRTATSQGEVRDVELNNTDSSVTCPSLSRTPHNCKTSDVKFLNKFPCPLCKSFFGVSRWVGRHMKKVHGQSLTAYLSEIRCGRKEYFCFVCNISVSNCLSLKNHMDQYHPGMSQSNLIATRGNLYFPSIQITQNSSDEARTVANSEKVLNPHSTEVLQNRNFEQTDLCENIESMVENTHMDIDKSNTGLLPARLSHKGEHICPCGNKFRNLSDLTRHLQTEHSKLSNELKNCLNLNTTVGVDNPITSQCNPLKSDDAVNDFTLDGSVGNRKSNLKKEYICRECGARFKNLAWFTRHRRVTGHCCQENELGPVNKDATLLSPKFERFRVSSSPSS